MITVKDVLEKFDINIELEEVILNLEVYDVYDSVDINEGSDSTLYVFTSDDENFELLINPDEEIVISIETGFIVGLIMKELILNMATV